MDLTDHLCRGLSEKNYDIVSSRQAGESSQIVCIKHRGGMSSNDVASDLESNAIIVSPRGDRIRIAPHFYNNAGDIDALLAALP
jgi:selenocysteine lyase/cysteine desulfurase